MPMSNANPPVWDVHHHWVNEEGYIDRLLKEMDRLNIERLGLIAMGEFCPDLFILHGSRQGAADNHALSRLLKDHGDRFWGWGFIRLGWHEDSDPQRLADMGLSGLKFHMPRTPYSDERYLSLFEQADKLNLPCIFHTGIFYPPTPMPGEHINSENCRPIHVEPIAHEFPDLRMIIAHLGVCWNQEAANLCRIVPNLYADLSGRVDGWRSSKPPEWFREMLYWPTAHKKILFGSDVHSDEIETTLEDHRRIFREMGWTDDQIADVMHHNARRVMGVD